MESNCSKVNILVKDVWQCEFKRLDEEKGASKYPSVDELQVPCMKSSKSGSNVTNKSVFIIVQSVCLFSIHFNFLHLYHK